MHGRKKIWQKCEFIGFENNRLNYICKNAIQDVPNEAIKNFSILYQFCKGDLNNLFCC